MVLYDVIIKCNGNGEIRKDVLIGGETRNNRPILIITRVLQSAHSRPVPSDYFDRVSHVGIRMPSKNPDRVQCVCINLSLYVES